MTDAGLLSYRRYVRYQESDVAAAEKTVRALLAMKRPPTALFAANNRNMIGAIRAASSTGPPTALAGFDDFELADMLNLPLIVVSYDAIDLGRQAARLLLDRVRGGRDRNGTSSGDHGHFGRRIWPPGGKYHLFGRADEGRAAAGS